MTGRRRILAWLAVAAAAVATKRVQAQPLADAPFDPAGFGTRDLRVIQAALTLAGDYNALLDGDWGRGSDAALTAHVRREAGSDRALIRHIVPLVRGFDEERRRSGWLTLHFPDLDVSLAVPATLARSTPETDPAWRLAVRWRAPDDSLDIALGILDRADMEQLHESVRTGHAPPSPQYVLRRPDRWVTGQHAADDRRTYMRSDAVSEGFLSVLATAAPHHEYRLAMIASSFTRGPAPELSPEPGGALAALLADG